MSLVVDMVSQRYLWDIRGDVSRWLHVQVWSLERRCELGLWFLTLCLIPQHQPIVFSFCVPPQLDSSQAARIRTDQGHGTDL